MTDTDSSMTTSAAGRKGGKSRSPAKLAAVRANGRKGGRPRAPSGYRIVRWVDGFYHVYFGGECIAEVMSHKDAIETARNHQKFNS